VTRIIRPQVRYDSAMKSKPQSEEYKRFESLLSGVLTVSKAELKERLETAKREKQTPKSASRASDEESSQA
jgi:hypothetical protein